MILIPRLLPLPRRLLHTGLLIILFWAILIAIRNFLLVNQPAPACVNLCPYSSNLTKHTVQFDPSHRIRHFSEFVCPQNFRNLADWIYGWPNQFDEKLVTTTNKGEWIAPCLPPGSIIYVRIWVIGEFFDRVYPHLNNNFVLVTGEGDVSAPTHLHYLHAPDSKIIHWFGQNGQYDASRIKKFTHLPIGINCYEMADAIRKVHSQQQNDTVPPVFNDVDEPSAYIHPQDITRRISKTTIPSKQLLLLNFDAGTDGSRLRARLWKAMCTRKNAHKFPYATCLTKPNGVNIQNLINIYERNRQYVFWLSPRGGGLDCHRTWEALYLDIIPIVWNNSLNVLYENLPVVIINNEQELNETFLRENLRDISRKKLSTTSRYQWEKLRHAYWRRLILEKSRHRNKKSIHRRTEQCWKAKNTRAEQNFSLVLKSLIGNVLR